MKLIPMLFSEKTPAEMQAEIDAWHCKREQGWLVDRLSTLAGIRRHKALEELEAEHAKLGYQAKRLSVAGTSTCTPWRSLTA